jgi:uncharacterized protein (DUF2126 family)/transglutaminase-like putative cysteine protease
MRVRTQHTTRYLYDRPAAFGPHLVRLRPATHTRARLLSYNLDISPADATVHWQQDPWGNHVARVTFPEGCTARELSFTVDCAFEVRPVNPFDFFVDDRCKQLPFRYPDGLEGELAPFLATFTPGPRLAALLAEMPAADYITDHLVAVNQRVAGLVRYIIRNEPGVQTSEETLTLGSGSCRDSARLLVDFFRAQGLAARFVSGYLVQLTDEGNIPDLARGVASDVIDLHAWCEVYVPGAGWVGLDGTSGLLCNEGHIPLSSAVDPALAAPIDGTSSEAAAGFDFSMNVSRLGHEPRPRTPYTDAQWAEIQQAGRAVDAQIAAAGFTLTMGGEPTFTSRLHPLEKEWITEALGDTKWEQGLRLAGEIRSRLGEGALTMHRMGKLYPGESLPRWVLHLLWRRDGQPIWRNPRLLDERVVADQDPASAVDARRFALALADRLGVSPELVAAHEDPWAAITRELNFPEDIDPLRADLSDPEERRTLARVLGQGLGAVVGYALPLGHDDRRWRSGVWTFRRGRLFLVPGDSPMGLRLPLDRLGGQPVELAHPPDRTAVSFTTPIGIVRQHPGAPVHPPLPPGELRTALCVEPRGGVLHVFLPPVTTGEAFLELIAAIEAVAGEQSRPVRIEGYGPPKDPRLDACLVTPDPGVLEVNVPVTSSFAEYVRVLEAVGEAAVHAGLSTEKYQVDGREVGSGGGNHLTLGGPSALESPFLRSPRLMASLLRFVQGHPSLSFLFTGLFVGPTSQAPRVDEGRHDALVELELALRQAEEHPDECPPWVTDRLFRNLLVDVAGNTHRTEICIDKLYDPHSAAGRQGILEFRAFEMPPHERMAAAQMLLLRSIAAAMMVKPISRPLVPWGTELHDRFMLPHFLWADLRAVLAEIAARGVALDEAFYWPFVDHRFPLLGSFTVDDVTLELRPALEPWPVLGEEAAGATVSRYVDSSLERLEVKVRGLTEGRHLVLVNGHTLPLRPTGVATERVAGVRFRAWQPPHCLQPHIKIQHPLRFDLVDTWADRSLGGCQYHVWHPDGRAYEDPPLTAYEAGARRAQRFTTLGHSSYPVKPTPASPSAEHPYTLDLRRVLGR